MLLRKRTLGLYRHWLCKRTDHTCHHSVERYCIIFSNHINTPLNIRPQLPISRLSHLVCLYVKAIFNHVSHIPTFKTSFYLTVANTRMNLPVLRASSHILLKLWLYIPFDFNLLLKCLDVVIDLSNHILTRKFFVLILNLLNLITLLLYHHGNVHDPNKSHQSHMCHLCSSARMQPFFFKFSSLHFLIL